MTDKETDNGGKNMQAHDGSLMTAGQFAARAGVTVRTIRFYDKIGLLPPSFRTAAGNRQYTMRDLARLQRILTLKYIGLSIDEIKQAIHRDGQEEDLRQSLRIQDTIIRRKLEHLRLVHKAVTETLAQLDSTEKCGRELYGQGDGHDWDSSEETSPSWELFTSIIRAVNQEEKWAEQYRNASNLHTRISLHDRFSVNPYNWHLWLFDQLETRSSPCSILEIGCGDGTLWKRNEVRIPADWKITLTDFSTGMLQDTKDKLDGTILKDRLEFMQADARSIPFPDCCFDMVLANHMLYHVNDRQQALAEIRRVLKPGGVLYASTIGANHLREMKELLAGFDSKLVLSETDFAEEFGLENGRVQLEAAGFRGVRLFRYEDSLRVTEAEPLVAYIQSTTGNSRITLAGAGLPKFKVRLKDLILQNGAIHITKESGLFAGYK
ncbi:MAG: methylase involved in ubiquinone/menaquinone biosynthesis [Paenibacillaceae bacterium]|jgi:ubiquinone/menaquinone biosynthesis C-methylase UbiE/DNA-binding transcriptional MerR regulator|nr:methylase involved in ubiquinone/menaquinone biosynthesis [Paenibacillaceae bacterium]